MRISVKNFGPIREANIRIAPLTLFVGPSNTGKSYMAKVISAAFESVRAASPVYKEDDGINLSFITNKSLGKKEKELEMEKRFSQWAENARHEWEKHVGLFFDKQSENRAQDKNMSAIVSSDDGRTFVNFRKSQDDKIKATSLSGLVKMAELIFKDSSYSDRGKKHVKISVQRRINARFFSSICDNLSQSIYYLPASRGGIMQSYHTIADKALKQTSVPRGKNDSRMISGIFGAFVRQLTGIEKREHGKDDIKAINEILVHKILGGRIDVKFPGGKPPDFRYVTEDKDELTMNDVSAAVAELAPLSIFMRHYLWSKNILIFEEPETGLHPQAQRYIADIMVRLVNKGVFVLATTHSTVVLEQISNAFRASQFDDTDEGRELLGKDQEPLGQELAVYSFMRKSGGINVKCDTMTVKTDFDSTTGILTEDHMDVSRELYDQTVNLVNGQNDE